MPPLLARFRQSVPDQLLATGIAFRDVHSPNLPVPTLTPTLPHHKAERSGSDQLFSSFNPDRDGGSLPGTARTPSTINSKTPPASSMPSISSSLLATLQVRCVAASSKTRPVTAHAQATPSTQVRNLLRASRHRLTPRQQERLREAFTADEAHISVDVAYHCAQQVREVFHQAIPAHGRRLAARLIQRLPACPTP